MLRNGLEPWHLVLVLLAFVVLFGAKRLPDTARNVGRALRIFKTEVKSLNDDQQPAVGKDTDPEAR
ncbi:MAG: Sec-independent protein translocase subunit TatA [Nocardioidaceae bacterium]